MGRIGKVAADLLRFQVPVIDDWLTLLSLIAVLLVFVGVVAFAIFWPLWHYIVRPVAAARGIVPLTAHDYLVRAWKAERQGRWADALRAYDQALETDERDTEARARREALLEDHPELLARPGRENERAVTPPRRS